MQNQEVGQEEEQREPGENTMDQTVVGLEMLHNGANREGFNPTVVVDLRDPEAAQHISATAVQQSLEDETTEMIQSHVVVREI